MKAVEELEAVAIDDSDDLYALRVALDAVATQLCKEPALGSFPNRATAELDDVLLALGQDALARAANTLYHMSRLSSYDGGSHVDVTKAKDLLSQLVTGIAALEVGPR